MEGAWASTHAKDSYLGAQYRRLEARRGVKRAIVAVAHTILVAIYWMLFEGSTYQVLGDNYFDQRTRLATVKRAARRIEQLGYEVILEAARGYFRSNGDSLVIDYPVSNSWSIPEANKRLFVSLYRKITSNLIPY